MFPDKIEKTIDKYNLLAPGDQVLAAFSGGPDSTALLLVLDELKEKRDFTLSAAHINHGLRREESDLDEAFCEAFCDERDIPFLSRRVNPGKYGDRSPEEAARTARYQALHKIAGQEGMSAIATGHTRNDQAETFLMRMIRGSGTEGLSGIHPVVEGEHRLIRPMIEVTSEGVMVFLRSRSADYRVDGSNENTDFLRNRIRLFLLPMLESEYNPRIVETLASAADILRDEDVFMNDLTEELFDSFGGISGDKAVFDKDELLSLPPPLRRRLIRKAIAGVKGDLRRIGFGHTRDIEELTHRQKGEKTLDLPGNTTAVKTYGKLEITNTSPPETEGYRFEFPYPGSFSLPGKGDFRMTVHRSGPFDIRNIAEQSDPKRRIFVDAGKMDDIIVVRNRREGDRFRPLGAPGEKKLKDFLIDRKVPASKRDRIPLFLSGDKIFWAVGLAVGDSFRVGEETSTVLEIERYD